MKDVTLHERTLREAITDAFYSTAINGGGTFDARSGVLKVWTQGYVVGVRSLGCYPIENFTLTALRNVWDTHAAYIGTRYDDREGFVYVDVVTHTYAERIARDLPEINEERCVWDCAHGIAVDLTR